MAFFRVIIIINVVQKNLELCLYYYSASYIINARKLY